MPDEINEIKTEIKTENKNENLIEVAADGNYDRLDVFLSEKLEISRTRIKSLLFIHKIIREDRKALKVSTKVRRGDKFLVKIPPSSNLASLEAEPIEIDTVYEDPYIVVINKPSGIIVHPAGEITKGTLVNGLVYKYPDMKNLTAWQRPGIVHRLDGGTSGLMVVARTEKAVIELQRMFREREIDKNYIAIVHGCPKRKEGTISGPIDRNPADPSKMAIVAGGRPSLTGYKVLWTRNSNGNKFSLVRFKLYSGRTHQIRVHFSGLGCPLFGDVAYGAPEKDSEWGRVFLHSWRLGFNHPVTGEKMSFRQNITPDFLEVIKKIRQEML